ncbi:FAD-dependent oxidoreductase [Prosthecomicrobium hirschii]|uniref:FAD-dependent oxidoreductase n=2 Tax=Prosthecodimorpha hirschii TaxID=665126 RepID=UPI002220BD73|nr:FAD-dependent oxidoreductase [Prosthecomicrobium hirschii]MCW1838855.1 FAD-dependent oxidoreductase [Prosthecomicrobium hirschii]
MATASSSVGFDEVFDAVVVGSGAAGLAAALTASIGGLSVLVVEKADTIGGSTAISGGAVWVPGHSHLGEVGLTESRAAVIDYLRAHLGNRLRIDMIEAFLDRGPEMIDFLERHTALRLAPRAVSPDYKPDLPGAAAGGRTLDPVVYDGRELGRDFARLRAPLKEFLVFGGMMVNRKDIDTLLSATRSAGAFLGSAALVLRFARDRLSQKRGTRLLMGNALAARLFKSALDRAIPIRERHAARDLIVENGRVVGLVVEGPSGPRRIGARRGVVLAAGGFPGSAAMRQALLPHADRHYSMAPAGNGGDGIRLAQGVGGRIGTDNVGNAFWAPVSVMREADGTETRFPHLILDRAKPGLVAVDGTGRRFVNEANSYHDFVEAMHLAQETRPAIPAWLVCDAAFVRRYGLGLVRPGLRPLGRFLKSGYLVKGETVEALARAMAVDPAALADTVARMNRYAETGTDPDFGKGSTAYNRYLGDAGHRPNPCLGPIRTAPFYAVRVWPGDIGTAAGLETDPHARVLGADRQPIPGLWACGNDMNSIMAGTYPSAGITLGPALTFGYIAGLDLASATP